MLADVHRVDVQVGLRRDDKDILLAVVGPEVAEGPGHRQEGNLVNVGAPPHRPCVT